MKRHRTIGALIVGFALLGPAPPAAEAASPFAELRAAHERNVRAVKRAHSRHVRAVKTAHQRHVQAHKKVVRHTPKPVREVHASLEQRHRAHLRAIGRADRAVASVGNRVHERHAAHRRDVSGAVALIERQREARHGDRVSALGSVGAAADRTHRRHVGALDRLADWLVDVTT